MITGCMQSILPLASGTPYVGDLGQAIAALLIFLGMLFVLGKYAWKPIVAMLERREADLQTRFDDADKSKAKADARQQEYDDQLAGLQQQTEQMLSDARQKATDERSALLASAREEARAAMQRADREMSEARQVVEQELRAEVAKMAADIAGQVIAKHLTPEQHQGLIDAAAKEMAHRGPEEA